MFLRQFWQNGACKKHETQVAQLWRISINSFQVQIVSTISIVKLEETYIFSIYGILESILAMINVLQGEESRSICQYGTLLVSHSPLNCVVLPVFLEDFAIIKPH